MGQSAIVPPSHSADIPKSERSHFYVELSHREQATKEDGARPRVRRRSSISIDHELSVMSSQTPLDLTQQPAMTTATLGRVRRVGIDHLPSQVQRLKKQITIPIGNSAKVYRASSLNALNKDDAQNETRIPSLAENKESASSLAPKLDSLNKSGADVNALDKESGDAVLHKIMKTKRRFINKVDMLLELLINSEVDVNLQNSEGDTALHIAIQNEEVKCIEVLIVFGADVHKRNVKGFTPYDLVLQNSHKLLEVVLLLTRLGAKDSLQMPIHNQHMELTEYSKTTQLRGSRILCLDGGGIKGLVQLEILMQLEEATGRTVVELFDWIVGTSTGGVIALALVYGKRSLGNLRQLYFKLKDRVFAKSRYGCAFDSDVFEEVLKEYLDPDMGEEKRGEMIMSDVSHPKVIVTAVHKVTTKLELHLFNNCFEDDYCNYPVWKVARYTSAAPMFFTEKENYVDGGLICNNPTEYGLTAIQDFCRKKKIELPISVVVSIGSGQHPAERMGVVDAQEMLSFGMQWLRPDRLINMTQNLFRLLSTALVESEMVVRNSECRCREQNIPFFRFNPQLDEVIATGETDNNKLFSMILQTKFAMKSWYKCNKKFSELVKLFHEIGAQHERVEAESPRLPSDKEQQLKGESSPQKDLPLAEHSKHQQPTAHHNFDEDELCTEAIKILQ